MTLTTVPTAAMSVADWRELVAYSQPEPPPPTKTIHYVRNMGYWQAFIGSKAIATRLTHAGLEKALRGLGLSPKAFELV